MVKNVIITKHDWLSDTEILSSHRDGQKVLSPSFVERARAHQRPDDAHQGYEFIFQFYFL